MEPIYVIKPKHLPPRIPLSLFGVIWLLLDRFQPPGWVWGVVGCLCALWLLLTIIAIFKVKYLIIDHWIRSDTFTLRRKPKTEPH